MDSCTDVTIDGIQAPISSFIDFQTLAAQIDTSILPPETVLAAKNGGSLQLPWTMSMASTMFMPTMNKEN